MIGNVYGGYVGIKRMLSEAYIRLREWLSPFPRAVQVVVVVCGLGLEYVLLLTVARLLLWLGVAVSLVAEMLFCGYVISKWY